MLKKVTAERDERRRDASSRARGVVFVDFDSKNDSTPFSKLV